MRRILVLGLLLAVGLAFVAGCGGKDTQQATQRPVERLKKPPGAEGK